MSLERRQTYRLSATLGALSKRLEVKSLNGRARSTRTSWNFTAQEVRMEKSASESGKERKNITVSKEGRKYSILSNEYGRLRVRGPHASSSPRSTSTVRGSDLQVVADVWRAHGDAQRLHLRSIRTRQKTGLRTRVTQCESTRADRGGEIWIGYSTSGANHETAPVSSSKCHERITLFVGGKSH